MAPAGRQRWDDARIERELRAVVSEHGGWMTAAQMRAAGHTDLLAAISRRGGMSQWARRLGYGGRRERWDEQRIERELRQMLAGRRDWPTPREFRDAGRSELYWAVKRHGGAGLWAKRMGVSAPRRGRPPGR